MIRFKQGDRVHYHGRHPGMIGLIGTVTRVEDAGQWLRVRWDDDTVQGCYPENVEIYVPDPVKEAIALLKQHGTVTFVPKFKPVTVKLNGEYNAVIHEDHVKVGCQQFKFDKVLELAVAVQKVKASLKY